MADGTSRPSASVQSLIGESVSMPFYTFNICNAVGLSATLDAKAFPDDGAAFEYAERVLHRHPRYDHVDVWTGEKAVAARFRDQPILRPIEGPRVISTQLFGFRDLAGTPRQSANE